MRISDWSSDVCSSDLDRAAMTQVRAKVRAERVVDVEVAGLVAPGDEVAVEVVDGPGCAGGEVLRVADREPAVGDRERGAGSGHRQLPSRNTRSAFSRRNFGHTSSFRATCGSSEKIRSSDKPIGK